MDGTLRNARVRVWRTQREGSDQSRMQGPSWLVILVCKIVISCCVVSLGCVYGGWYSSFCHIRICQACGRYCIFEYRIIYHRLFYDTVSLVYYCFCLCPCLCLFLCLDLLQNLFGSSNKFFWSICEHIVTFCEDKVYEMLF